MSDVAAKIFEESLNKVVLVQLKGGRNVRGRLYSFDQHMNLVLEEAEDVTNTDATKKLGTIIVRWDSVVLVSPVFVTSSASSSTRFMCWSKLKSLPLTLRPPL